MATVCGVVVAAAAGCSGTAPQPHAHPCDPQNLIWVYERNSDPGSHSYPIRVYRSQSGQESTLTNDDTGEPAVSPDGTSIVFVRGSDGDPESAGYLRHQLFVMDSDGDDERALLDPAHEIPAGNPQEQVIRWDRHPAWSPDGTRIAFIREAEEGGGVMTVSSSGGPPTLLSSSVGTSPTAVAWSADGSRLAWTGWQLDSGTVTWSDLDGRNAGQAKLDSYPGSPAWSQDGGTVLVPVEAETPVDTHLLQISISSGQHTDLGTAMAGLWLMPDGAIAGLRANGTSHVDIVVLDLDANAGGASSPNLTVIDTFEDRYVTSKPPVTAVPDRPDGWSSCPE